MKNKKLTLPGEELATIEEFNPSFGSYSDGDKIRSKLIGKVKYDYKERVIIVEPLIKKLTLPSEGDEIIGLVELAQGPILNIRITHINGERSNKGFIGLALQEEVKVGDLVKGKVISLENGVIHLSLDGVIYTTCPSCGGKVKRIRENSIKCLNCGHVESRKLAKDFGNLSEKI